MLNPVTRKQYDQVCEAVPEHPRRILEIRRPGSAEYMKQYVFDEKGNLVALDDDQGRYADLGYLAARTKTS